MTPPLWVRTKTRFSKKTTKLEDLGDGVEVVVKHHVARRKGMIGRRELGGRGGRDLYIGGGGRPEAPRGSVTILAY